MQDYTIKQATPNELEDCAYLFNEYRIFYKAESAIQKAKEFIGDRLEAKDSIIFLLYRNKAALGFAQLYPTYSSFKMAKVAVLNDLFVIEHERGQGYGRALIRTVSVYAKENGFIRISLSTARDNPAQFLYESIGFKESHFKFYNLDIL
ncbi:GNAT family N-acetyltransferase [Olivibacter sp. XZL3]|uniref:GNAT family N-acetyltransferase n=1 Tax=Olivibacter sp. XZL3 TaxID=1735116 RepID=UPI001064C46C|nr:GNAT family N-acetyltransferase [Olivibacter sp. XZL3]